MMSYSLRAPPTRSLFTNRWCEGVFQCPINSGADVVMGNPAPEFVAKWRPLSAYTYNANGVGMGSPYTQGTYSSLDSGLGLGGTVDPRLGLMVESTATHESSVREPSEMITMGDGFNRSLRADYDGAQCSVYGYAALGPKIPWTSFMDTWNTGGPHPSVPFKQQASFLAHRGRFNRIYCDNHIEVEDMNKLFV